MLLLSTLGQKEYPSPLRTKGLEEFRVFLDADTPQTFQSFTGLSRTLVSLTEGLKNTGWGSNALSQIRTDFKES